MYRESCYIIAFKCYSEDTEHNTQVELPNSSHVHLDVVSCDFLIFIHYLRARNFSPFGVSSIPVQRQRDSSVAISLV